ESRQIADQRAVRHQRTLGWTGRTTRIDKQCRIRRQGWNRREAVDGARKQRTPLDAVGALTDADQMLKMRTVEPQRLHGCERRSVADCRDRAAVLQAVFECLGS